MRTIEIETGRGLGLGKAAGIWGDRTNLWDELLNGELFYSLYEAQVLIERWRC
ncbi:MAG: hypothetical protein QM706_12995 [Nitrospira sp.]